MKNLYIAAILLVVVMALAVLLLPRCFYPQTMVVEEIDREQDLVAACTASGLLYAFYGAGDLEAGDLVACILWNGLTPSSVLDDAIISARYAGVPSFFER